MSSDLNIVFAPNLNQRSLSEAQRKGLIRIVKAQVILLITDLNNNNFIERLSEIDDVSHFVFKTFDYTYSETVNSNLWPRCSRISALFLTLKYL